MFHIMLKVIFITYLFFIDILGTISGGRACFFTRANYCYAFHKIERYF